MIASRTRIAEGHFGLRPLRLPVGMNLLDGPPAALPVESLEDVGGFDLVEVDEDVVRATEGGCRVVG
jgi:hypothetical protein